VLAVPMGSGAERTIDAVDSHWDFMRRKENGYR